jgi:hypothetical protein
MPDLRLVEAGGFAIAKPKAKGIRRRTKAQRDAIKAARLAVEAATRIDADLSRAIDAISFLAQNEIDPAPLIARISPMEVEAVSVNIQKAVDWLNRFADGWHVFIGGVEAQGASSRTDFETGSCRGIRLVRCRD